MPGVLPILIVIILVGAFSFMIIQNFRRKGMQWSGVVIDKNSSENISRSQPTVMNNQSSLTLGSIRIGGSDFQPQQRINLQYYIIVKTDDGKELRWNVSEGLYQTLNIGDKLKKDSGTMIPEVVAN